MQLPEYVVNLLGEIAQKESFINYKYEVKLGSEHGDGFIAELTAIKLTGKRLRDGEAIIETLNLLCKTVPQSKERRDTFRSIPAFKREIFMYTRVLPLFVKFQQEKGLSPEESFLSFPKVYATVVDEVNDKYALIMEDLRPRQFVMWSQKDTTDSAHEELLLKQLGRFHGISFALKDQRPEVFAEFKALEDVITDMINNGFQGLVFDESFERAVKVLINEDHKKIVDEYRSNSSEIYKMFVAKGANERFGALNHGDCWVNNFLFQYEEKTSKVKDICFLDWQVSVYASPALDLHLHFFSSTRKALRDRSYNELLNVYHTALSNTVRKLGSDPEKLFSFPDLMNELKACGKWAILIGISMIPQVLCEENEIADMEDYSARFAKGEKVILFRPDMSPNSEYTLAINEVVGDIIDYGFYP